MITQCWKVTPCRERHYLVKYWGIYKLRKHPMLSSKKAEQQEFHCSVEDHSAPSCISARNCSLAVHLSSSCFWFHPTLAVSSQHLKLFLFLHGFGAFPLNQHLTLQPLSWSCTSLTCLFVPHYYWQLYICLPFDVPATHYIQRDLWYEVEA